MSCTGKQILTAAKQFARRTDGAVATWFAILLIPMLGMTFGAIKFAEFSSHRSGMIDAMDAAGLGLARQMEFENLEACDLASADTTDPADLVGQDRLRLERFAREFFEENYPEYSNLYADDQLSRPFDLATDMNFTLTCAYIEVAATAFVDMGGTLGEYFGVGALPLDLDVEISLPGAGRVEIALVLDITGSMCRADTAAASDVCASSGNRRIDKLATAVNGMLDDPNIFGPAADASNNFVRMSVVPFNSMVNAGPSYSGISADGTRGDSTSAWTDNNAEALYHGANYFHAEVGAPVTGPNYYEDDTEVWTNCATENAQCTPPDLPRRVRYGANGSYAFGTASGTFNCNNATFGDPIKGVRKSCEYLEDPVIRSVSDTSDRVVVDADRKVNHFDLFASVGPNGATWKGCLEARPFPMDEGLFEPGFAPMDINAMWTVPTFVATGTADMQTAWSAMRPRSSLPYTAGLRADTRFVPFFYGDEPDCSLRRDLNGDGDTSDSGDRNACSFLLASGPAQNLRVFSPDEWTGFSDLPSYFFNSQTNDTDPSVPDLFVDESFYNNRDFIDEVSFLLPFESVNSDFATDEDFAWYRNLMFDLHEQLGSDATKTNCLSDRIEYPVVFSQDLIDVAARLGIDDCRLQEYKLRQGYVGVWRNEGAGNRYYGKYENLELSTYDPADDAPTNESLAGIGPNRGCSGPILPLTSTKADVVTKLAALDPGGTTNTAVGMIWGWRTLSHQAPFVEGADPSTPAGGRWKKYAILMTDGNNTQSLAASSNASGTRLTRSHNFSDMGPYGYLAENRLDMQTSGRGTSHQFHYANEFDRKTIRICHRMREEGIKVFTIGFAITPGSDADKMLAACAVDTDAYTLAADGAALADAFEDITEQIVELHVSG